MDQYCKNHNKSFGYTCPACDAAYSFIGRSNAVPFFDAGARGDPFTGHSTEEKAAYEYGLKFQDKTSKQKEKKQVSDAKPLELVKPEEQPLVKPEEQPLVKPEEQPTDALGLSQKYSLMELVEKKNSLYLEIEKNFGEVTDEMDDLLDMAESLLKGKIDRVAIFIKEVIPSHIEACQAQIKTLRSLSDRVKDYTIQCIKLQGPEEKQISGLSWRARVQKNPPSINVLNEEEVPFLFKRGKVTIEADFDPADADTRAYWENVIDTAIDRSPTQVRGEVKLVPDLAQIKEVLKGGDLIPGVKMEQGEHVRFEEGKAKAKKVEAKKSKAKKSLKEMEQD